MRIVSVLVLSLSLVGCTTVQSLIPSFWDDNQSKAIINVRQSIVQLNCEEPHAPQAKKIKDHIQWFDMYSESKGQRQQDVRKLIKPMQETVDDFYKRSLEKEGTKTYCEIKKKVMITQSEKAASAVLGRF